MNGKLNFITKYPKEYRKINKMAMSQQTVDK